MTPFPDMVRRWTLTDLAELVGNAHVVAIGENNHHIREFGQLRERIVRFLVTELDFGVVAFESGFAEGQLVDSIPFPKGCTCKENLICLCRYHHFLKTHGNWTALLMPDGTYHVTSPTGEIYTTRPPAPGDVAPPTRTGKSIYTDPRDDPDFRLPRAKPEPYPEVPPF